MSDVEIDSYLEESGPGVLELPESNGQPPPAQGDVQDPLDPSLYPGWEQETVETFLQGTGAGIHMLIGQTERDWLMTSEDLRRMGAPLTRICNRWEPALKLSPAADPLLFGHGAFLYAWRSMLEAKRHARDAEQLADAGPGYTRGPEPDDDAEEKPGLDLGDLQEHAPYFEGGPHDDQ